MSCLERQVVVRYRSTHRIWCRCRSRYRYRSAFYDSSCRLDTPCSYVRIPASVIFTAAEIERHFHLISDLKFLKISDLVLAPDIHAHLSREISLLILQDEFLFRPGTSC